MARLDTERQFALEPKRMEYAIEQLNKLGYFVTRINDYAIQFLYKEKIVTLYPYSGYFSGKTVITGRGVKNLLKQIKP